MSKELVDAVRASAGRLGISPSDLLTVISYETAGTLDPWQKGPTTQHGQHRGLLQWGEPQRKKYGVTQDMSVADQMRAAERYLTDTGVKPGHGILDLYAAVNAGGVGRYNRSDAHNGGAPGTVADKVATQMAGHRLRANALLGGEIMPPAASPGGAPSMVAGVGGAPLSMAPAGGGDAAAVAGGVDPVMAALMRIPAAVAQEETPELEPMQIQYAAPPGLAKARALARAMSNNSLG